MSDPAPHPAPHPAPTSGSGKPMTWKELLGYCLVAVAIGAIVLPFMGSGLRQFFGDIGTAIANLSIGVANGASASDATFRAAFKLSLALASGAIVILAYKMTKKI